MILVMATGTGKTFTAFQIIHRLYKSGSKNKIFVGEVLENDLLINNVHYFTNNDIIKYR